MSFNSSSAWVIEQRLADDTRVYTTSADLDAPIAQIHCVFALPSLLPTIAGETAVLLEWMQRGTVARSRSEIFDAFGALGIEPQLTLLPSGILFSMQCLDACRTLALSYARELLYEPAFDEDELADVLEELNEDDRASRDDPDQISYRAQRLARWHGTALSAPLNGTTRTRKSLDISHLKKLHAQIFERPAILGIASAEPAAWVHALEASLVHDRPLRTHAYLPPSASAIAATPRDVYVHAPTLEHAVVVRYSPGPKLTPTDALAETFLHHEALTDGMSAPLMVRLRGQQSLSYAVSSQLIDRGDGWDQCFEIEPSPDRVEEALDAGRALWAAPDVLTEEDFRRARIGLITDERLQTIDARRALSHSLRHDVLWNRPVGSHQDRVHAISKAEAARAQQQGIAYGMTQPPLCTIVLGNKKKLAARFRAEIIDLDRLFDGWSL